MNANVQFLMCALPVLALSIASSYTNTMIDCILTGFGGIAFLVINREFILGFVKKVLKKA